MRFLHTGDWQVGMRAAHVGASGEAVRKRRIDSLHRLVGLANDRHVDFILVAGDCFEDNGVDRILVQKTVDALGKSTAPVYIIPGNHDPWSPGSVWEYPSWKQNQNLHLLSEPQPVPIPGGTLHPCPLFEKRSRRDPTSWIQAAEGEGIQIGLAHGTVEGVLQDEPDYPISRDSAVRAGLDYLALGHWHSTTLYPDESGIVRMAYSGTHETTKFGERDSGNLLLVEIEERGAPPKIETIRSGGLAWLRIDREFRQSGDSERLLSEIDSIADPENTLVQTTIDGLIPPSELSLLPQIERVLQSRFLYHRFETGSLRPTPEDHDWVAELPSGIIQETGRRLLELADPTYTGTRPPLGTPEMAARALLELYSMTMEETQ